MLDGLGGLEGGSSRGRDRGEDEDGDGENKIIRLLILNEFILIDTDEKIGVG